MKIYQRPAFIRALKKLSERNQELVRQRARRMAEILGHPHEHSGIGLRAFGRYREFRIGLKLRCLFLLESGDIHLVIVGTHDEAAAYIRNNG
jgi:mRNA-degrading endonuclease RelE of RelBE toxin-antitoxin system